MAKPQANDKLQGREQVSVRREDDKRVVLPAVRQMHQVNGERDIDALLLRRQALPASQLAAITWTRLFLVQAEAWALFVAACTGSCCGCGCPRYTRIAVASLGRSRRAAIRLPIRAGFGTQRCRALP